MNRESKAKHTAGPWSANEATITYTQFNITAKDSFIGEVGGGLQSDDEIEANARLIAASPEMYETLREVYSASANGEANDKHLRKRILELIKKIEG